MLQHFNDHRPRLPLERLYLHSGVRDPADDYDGVSTNSRVAGSASDLDSPYYSLGRFGLLEGGAIGSQWRFQSNID